LTKPGKPCKLKEVQGPLRLTIMEGHLCLRVPSLLGRMQTGISEKERKELWGGELNVGIMGKYTDKGKHEEQSGFKTGAQ